METEWKKYKKIIALLVLVSIVGAGVAVWWSTGEEEEPEKEPIKIGILQDMTGGLAFHGEWGFRGTVAAIERINEAGGIDGRLVEYVLEDSATSASTGLTKFKKLVLEDGVDFVIGPCNTGVDLAINPYAREMNTVYFNGGTAVANIQEFGNRYVFRVVNDMRSEMRALALVAMEEWDTFYGMGADYEWGHSVVEETAVILEETGSDILAKVWIVAGTTDFLPYLRDVDPTEVDAIIAGFYGADARALITQAGELGYTNQLVIIGNWGISMGQEADAFGAASEDEAVWVTTIYPMRHEFIPEDRKEYDKFFREQIDMTLDGRDVKTGKMGNPMFAWSTYEAVNMIKEAIDESGWECKEDNPSFIEALEGMSFELGNDFPAGDIFMRAADHQCFSDGYIEVIDAGKWKCVARISGGELIYETTQDFTEEEFV